MKEKQTEIKIINPPIHVHKSGTSEKTKKPNNDAQINLVNCKGITKVVSLKRKACVKHQWDNKPAPPMKAKIINWLKFIFCQ